MKYLFFSLFAILGFSSSVFAQIPSYIPKDSLVGWWPFNGNANDESGNGNNGTVYNSSLTTNKNGTPNSAYQFSNSADYIKTSAKPQNITKLSISLWFITSNGGYFINQGQHEGGPHLGMHNSFTGGAIHNGKIFFYQSNSAGGFGTMTDSVYNDNKWHSLIAVLNGYNTSSLSPDSMKIYIDGRRVKYSTVNTVSGSFPKSPSSSISIAYGTDPNSNYIGNIDDVGIWSRALDFDEVKSIYSGTNSSANLNNYYSESRIKYFPNPVNDILNIQGVHTISNYQITNAIGQTVMLGKLTEKIDVSALNSGMYLLITETGTLRFTKE
jgi:hypothetical protein